METKTVDETAVDPLDAKLLAEQKTETETAVEPSTIMVETTSVEAILEELIRHRVDHLYPWLSDKPPPEWWEGDGEEWRSLVEVAREGMRPAALSWIVENVTLGWTLRERLADRLTAGSKEAADGTVRRPPRGVSPDFLLGQAQRLIGQLRAGALYDSLEVVLQLRLERPATETQQALQAAIDAAEAILEEARLEKERRFADEAGKVHVRVFAPCGPARKYTPGDYELTPAEVQELRTWERKVESNAHGRSLASLGHSCWPPYEVVVE